MVTVDQNALAAETKRVANALYWKNVQAKSPPDPTMFERYRGALRRYIAAADSLEGLSGPEFEEAYRRVEEARKIFEQLRAQLAEGQTR